MILPLPEVVNFPVTQISMYPSVSPAGTIKKVLPPLTLKSPLILILVTMGEELAVTTFAATAAGPLYSVNVPGTHIGFEVPAIGLENGLEILPMTLVLFSIAGPLNRTLP